MRRYISDMPELTESLKREQHHEPAKKYDELTNEHKIAFKAIAHEIRKVCDCNVYAFGSRVNGNYNSNSDYDVVVYCDNIFKHVINRQIFSFKADIHFTNKQRTDLIEI